MPKPSVLAREAAALMQALDDLPPGPPVAHGPIAPATAKVLSFSPPEEDTRFPRFKTAREAAEAWCVQAPSRGQASRPQTST